MGQGRRGYAHIKTREAPISAHWRGEEVLWVENGSQRLGVQRGIRIRRTHKILWILIREIKRTKHRQVLSMFACLSPARHLFSISLFLQQSNRFLSLSLSLFTWYLMMGYQRPFSFPLSIMMAQLKSVTGVKIHPIAFRSSIKSRVCVMS